jgi:Domain of unknown function (DUF4062)/NACHT domain
LSPSETPLSFGAEQLLEALDRRARLGGRQPSAHRWLLALLDVNRRAAEEAGADADLDALAAAARRALEGGELLDRDEVEARAARRAARLGHRVVPPADVAFAILAAQPAPAVSPEAPSAPAAPTGEPEPAPTEPPELPLSFAAEQLLASLFAGQAGLTDLHEVVLRLLGRHRDVAEQTSSGGELAALERTIRERLDRGEAGERVARDGLAREAVHRAHQHGRAVVASADLASAVLEAGWGIAAVPPPLAAEEPAAPEVERREERGAPERPRTFRVFVSSTFDDLEAERNALAQHVYPALRSFCAQHGARFQPIDLRWGVSEEASLDQQAMNICLGEIERCRELTPRPNFLVLLGDRYGWRPPPPQIPADELERILERVSGPDEKKLIEEWYRRDENAVPPEYHLRPREADGPYDKWDDWAPVERRLRSILLEAVKGTELESDRRYGASATEQEIAAGALAIGAPEGHAFCFIREIELGENDPRPGRASEKAPIGMFVDPDQTRLRSLKETLEDELPLRHYKARWDGERNAPTTDHLADLAKDVHAALKGAIESELANPTEPPGAAARTRRIEPDEHLDAEGEAHREFADERVRFFVGRDELLGQVGQYLAAADRFPLVLHGEGGTGKSALMAEAVLRAQDRPATQLVYRFIGATPGSSDGRGLLEGICRELARRYGADEAEVPTDYQELSADFRKRLGLARPDRPLVLVIDSLDQLAPSHGARRLTWIPEPLPEHVRLVVSTRLGDTKEQLAQRLERARQREARLIELGPMSRDEGGKLLELWLSDAGRTLRDDQRDAVLNAFARSEGNPLYLRLAFEEARRWIGDQDPEELAVGVDGIIQRNTFARLAREDNHGEVLVSHALGYLAASRYGIAEDELLDLLSRDREVYRRFVLGSYHVPLDLRERLDAYLSDGTRQELHAAKEDEGGGAVDEVAEWVRQVRDGVRATGELDDFLADVLPRRGKDSLGLPVVLWSRLYADLRPYLTEPAFEDTILISFYHRELAEVARQQYLGDERDVNYHGRLADYFRPDRDGDGRPGWAEASLHGLSELPYHLTLAGEERWDELHDTLTDFRFLEEKAQRVGKLTVRDAEGNEVTTYTGVQLLQDDFELALREMGGGEEAGRPRIIVTATDLGEGLAVRCPHCNVVHGFDGECPACKAPHELDEWRGKEIQCPNASCKGPLKVNEFVVERRAWG